MAARKMPTGPLPPKADLNLQTVARLIAAVYWPPIRDRSANCQCQALIGAPETASDESESRCYQGPVE
jgi:hypothetical protein